MAGWLGRWTCGQEVALVGLTSSSLSNRPDMTFMVDWALKNNYLSYPPSLGSVSSPFDDRQKNEVPCASLLQC